MYGDVSTDDGEEARQALARVLEEEVALPVVMDEDRLRRRLSVAMDGAALDEAVGELLPEDLQMDPHRRAVLADLLGTHHDRPGARTRHELEHVVVSCPDPSLLSVDTRRMLDELVASIRSCISRYEMRHRVKQWGAARTLEEIANRTLGCMRLTSRTWDALEAADLDDLTFVYTAICMDNHEWHLHHAIRAVIENPGMRKA